MTNQATAEDLDHLRAVAKWARAIAELHQAGERWDRIAPLIDPLIDLFGLDGDEVLEARRANPDPATLAMHRIDKRLEAIERRLGMADELATGQRDGAT
ncbi:hypothetical protein D3C72_780860 [compost metagenome]